MSVFTPEFSTLLRRVVRLAAPLAALGVLAVLGGLVALTLRHRSRERRGLVTTSRARTRTRIAPIP